MVNSEYKHFMGTFVYFLILRLDPELVLGVTTIEFDTVVILTFVLLTIQGGCIVSYFTSLMKI